MSATRTLINTAGRANLPVSSSSNNSSEPYSSQYHPLRDTSVNIANALQAATMPGPSQNNTNTSMSGSTLAASSISSLAPSSSRRFKKPTSSASTSRAAAIANRDDETPDVLIRARSPAELAQLARAKSPLFEVHLREADQQASFQSMTQFLDSQQDHSRSQSVDETNLQSRDYSVLDQDVAAEEARQQLAAEPPKPTKVRRKQHNNDNKLYKPADDEDEDDDAYSDDDSRTKRKKKAPGGRATLDGSLPVIAKSKKRKSHGGRKSISNRNQLDESVASEGSIRASPPPPQEPPSVDEIAADEIADDLARQVDNDDDEMVAAQDEPSFTHNADAPTFGIGQFIGVLWVSVASVVYAIYSVVALVARQATSLLFTRPAAWVKSNKGVLTAVSIAAALIAYQAFAPTHPVNPSQPARGGLFDSIFGRSPRPYVPAGPLPDNWDDFTSQLAAMQSELATISKNMHRSDQSSAIKAVEQQIEHFGRKHQDIEGQLTRVLNEMRQSLDAVSKKRERDDTSGVTERFAKIDVTLERLQEALRRVEAVADASPVHIRELEKKVAAIGTAQTRSSSAGRASKDVSPAAAEYFQALINRAFNDRIAIPDYAIFSAGGRVIPTLTSPTYEIPGRRSWTARMFGFGGTGGAHQGRPPATALTPDINVGHCWPFAGSKGHLGVFLKEQIFVSSVSIDHASRDVAYDITPAPKRVRVWGVVDGADNIEKLRAYREELQVRKDVGSLSPEEQDELDAVEPARLPHELQLLQLTTFSYDVEAATNVQTFPVPERIKSLGIDIGVVIIDIQSNHGNPEYTCLYRARVHGTPRSKSLDADESSDA